MNWILVTTADTGGGILWKIFIVWEATEKCEVLSDEERVRWPVMFYGTALTTEMESDVFGQKLDFLLRMCTWATASSLIDWLAALRPQHDYLDCWRDQTSFFFPSKEFYDTKVVTFFLQTPSFCWRKEKKNTSKNKSRHFTKRTHLQHVPI